MLAHILIPFLNVKELINVSISDLLVLFDCKYYKQIDKVAMDSLTGLTCVNIFINYHEEIWLKNCPCELRFFIYKIYFGESFFLFQSKDNIQKFQSCLNC